MPIYTFACDACGHTREVVRRIAKVPRWVRCRKCGGRMDRDLKADLPAVHGDPDACQGDIDRYVEIRQDNKRRAASGRSLRDVDRPVLSRALARVPGVRKIRGKDGQPYAVFENKADRAKAYRRMGLQDGA